MTAPWQTLLSDVDRVSGSHASFDHIGTTLPSTTVKSPHRTSHQTSSNSSLLLMPCWSLAPSLPYIGVKLVTVHPNNSALNKPSIHGSYVMFEAAEQIPDHYRDGRTAAVLDGTEMTVYRTACVSGLASRFLSKEDSKVLVMVGAGALAPHLIRAHLAARPSIKKVIIWNRRTAKAATLADKMINDPKLNGISFQSSEHLANDVAAADIVSCATNSETPLVEGSWLKAGAHLDLVGSYTETESMRECDDEAIRKGRVYVDNDVAMVEAGELLGVFKRGIIRPEDVVGTLVELVKGDKAGRENSEEITVFKSVGSAVVDMLAAQLIYETFLKNQQVPAPG